MSWPSRDEFLENNIDKIKDLLTSEENSLLKQYESKPKLYIEKFKQLWASSGVWGLKFSWDNLYKSYKLDSLPKWGDEDCVVFPRRLNGLRVAYEYEELITNSYEEQVFECPCVKKWGIRVNDPNSKAGIYRYNSIFVYELVGLQGERVTLQQIRNCVKHLHKFADLVCLA